MSNTWRLIVATSFLSLGVLGLVGDCTWVRTHNTASADDAFAERELADGKAEKRKPTLDDVLVSRIDFSVKSASAVASFDALADAVRKSLPGVPEDFAIVIVGADLQIEGITRNQRIRNIDVKGATVAEVLTAIASKMNPITTVRDPADRNQKVVWTIGPNPRDLDKKRNVILITTRSAAKKKAYRLPAAFLPEAERMDRLVIRGKPLAAAAPKIEPPMKREFKWSEVISSETLESEVKRVKLALDKDVTRPATFSRGGYKSARRNFSELVVLFGIIQQYDKLIRWQNEANDASQRFARSARNCKVGTIQSFNEAKQRLEDLSTLVRGDRLAAKVGPLKDRQWGDLVERSPLMQRMEKVLSDELSVQLADAKTFAKNGDDIRHSAELIAAIANVLGQPNMEDAEDADYTTHSNMLSRDARKIVDATRTRDHAAAKTAYASLKQNCSNCHQDWR